MYVYICMYEYMYVCMYVIDTRIVIYKYITILYFNMIVHFIRTLAGERANITKGIIWLNNYILLQNSNVACIV